MIKYRSSIFALLFLTFFSSNFLYSQETNYKFSDIKENIIKECVELRSDFLPTTLNLEIARREIRTESFNKSHIIVKKNNADIFLMESLEESENVQYILGTNQRYCFNIYKKNSDSGWILDGLLEVDKNSIIEHKSSLFVELFFIETALQPMLYINHLAIDALLQAPTVVCNSITTEKSDGEEIIIVKLQVLDAQEEINGFPINFSNIVLYISKEKYGWLPFKYSHTSQSDKDSFTRQVLYDKFENYRGINIPSVMYASKSKNDEPFWDAERYEFQWSFDELRPNEEFTLSHYGLPEPDFGARKPNRIRFIIMGIGLVMIGVGAWRSIQKRRGNL